MMLHNWWIVYETTDGRWGALDRRDQPGFEYHKPEWELQLVASAMATDTAIRTVFLIEAASRYSAIKEAKRWVRENMK